jgi:hypothetical protein
MDSLEPCLSATWGMVNPLDKSIFGQNANVGILTKCLEIDYLVTPKRLAILS